MLRRMSLGIVIKGPEAIVLAAESRVTLTTTQPNGQQLHVNFDNASKLLFFSNPNSGFGCVIYGQAAIGIRSVPSFLPEFESTLPPHRLPIVDFAQRFSDFFISQWTTMVPQDTSEPT
jgi:hypothetical protein